MKGARLILLSGILVMATTASAGLHQTQQLSRKPGGSTVASVPELRACGDADFIWTTSEGGGKAVELTNIGQAGRMCETFESQSSDVALSVMHGQSCQDLRGVDFSSANLGQSAAEVVVLALADRDGKTAFCRPGFLREVFISDNGLGDDGAAAIAKAIAVDQGPDTPARASTIILGLERNAIGDAGAVSLATALSVKHRVSDLRVDGNPIGGIGAIAIARAFDHGASLNRFTYFDLTGEAASNSSRDTLNKEEGEFFRSLYLRELEAALPYLGSGCGTGPKSYEGCEEFFWPSCQLMRSARLAPYSTSLDGCRSVSSRMASMGVGFNPTNNGLAAFEVFMMTDPVAILGRAVRRHELAVRPRGGRFGDPIPFMKSLGPHV